MAQMVSMDPGLFRHRVYGERNESTMQFIQNAYEGSRDILQRTSSAMLERIEQSWEKYSSEASQRRLKAAARNIENGWKGNRVRPLRSIGELQTAPPIMQRYMMAEPTTRARYQRGQCEGFRGSYVDLFEGQISYGHYDWRRVMDGMIEEDSEGYMVVHEFGDDLLSGDVELEFDQKRSIRDTWAFQVAAFAKDEDDPTSRWNASL